MRFSRQHVTIKNILQKHWSILTDDPKLKTFLPKQPSITFRRATSLKDTLVQSEFKNQHKRSKQCHITGSFPCGHCTFCPLIRKAKSFRLPNGEIFKPSHFANCQTRGVVYFMECDCGAYYIGKTKQELWRRVSKHMYSMEIGDRYLPTGRHVVYEHNYKLPNVTFTVLQKVQIPERGGDWNKVLLQKEQKWIFHLQAMSPPRLNESISFAPFLSGFSSVKTH